MNYLILGINGDIGKSIFENLYNEKDNFILTYGNKKPDLKKKNVFLYKLNFKLVEKNIIKINKILKKFKDIDIVINNVGDSNPFKNLLKINPKELEKSLKINFYSAYFIILQILKNRLKKNKPLNIINISSNTIKYLGSDKNLPYLVSKNALEISLMNLSKIFSKKKIKINIIRPGVIKTKKSTKINNYNKKIFLNRVSKIPAGQAGTPQDISSYVKYLTNDKSKFIFGQIITIAGGE
jgi:NAD(P)-dependent dehydrogenase (short-subunit alcohol dehydrogenase family)